MNGVAHVGMVFGHLVRFYSERWPDRLAFFEVPEAAQFGTDITVAKTNRVGTDPALIQAFTDFLFENAPQAYEDAGFTWAESFPFGRWEYPMFLAVACIVKALLGPGELRLNWQTLQPSWAN